MNKKIPVYLFQIKNEKENNLYYAIIKGEQRADLVSNSSFNFDNALNSIKHKVKSVVTNYNVTPDSGYFKEVDSECIEQLMNNKYYWGEYIPELVSIKFIDFPKTDREELNALMDEVPIFRNNKYARKELYELVNSIDKLDMKSILETIYGNELSDGSAFTAYPHLAAITTTRGDFNKKEYKLVSNQNDLSYVILNYFAILSTKGGN